VPGNGDDSVTSGSGAESPALVAMMTPAARARWYSLALEPVPLAPDMPLGFIDDWLTRDPDSMRAELDAMETYYLATFTTDAAWALLEANTGTALSLSKTEDEANGAYTGKAPRLVAEAAEEDMLAAFPVPDGQKILASVNLSLARGNDPYTPDTFDGMTLTFTLERDNTGEDGITLWWQTASGEWVSMPCPPNDSNTIEVTPAETLGVYIITINGSDIHSSSGVPLRGAPDCCSGIMILIRQRHTRRDVGDAVPLQRD